MQVIRSFRRVEITFWTAMIALMRSKRLVKIAIIAACLLLCVSVAGIANLTLDRDPTRSSQELVAPVSQPQAAASAVPSQDQRNILVILVDSLSTSNSQAGRSLAGR